MYFKNKISLKKQLKNLLLISISIVLFSCEDVVDVDVPTEEPRLVIEASLDWEKGTTGNDQTVKLSMSTPYFDTTPSPVSGAMVKVTNQTNGSIYIFNDQEDGRYTISNFEPIINHIYLLEVAHDNEIYSAEETLYSVPDFNRIEQSYDGGFNDEALEVTYYFDDPPNIENYYLSSFQEVGELFQNLEDMSDEFTDGNEMFNFYEKDNDDGEDDDNFRPGDVVDISLYGISETYYNFISLLIEQYDSGGDPFSAIPAEIKGNCINLIHPENYAYGYFRVTEVVRASYTFE